jgi:hypothetical protein
MAYKPHHWERFTWASKKRRGKYYNIRIVYYYAIKTSLEFEVRL